MKKILILGGSGLVGTALQSVAHLRGYSVVAPGHSEVDLTDPEALDAYITQTDADVIINSAAVISIDSLEQDPIPAWQINTVAAGVIARAASKRPGSTLIYLSTQLVFDGTKVFYAESDATSPTTTYGITKYEGEVLTRHFATLGHIRHHIVRTALVYGEKRKTFVDEVAKTLKEGKTFEAATDQYSNPTRASDLAEAIFTHFIDVDADSGVFHLINQTPERGVSRYEIAQEIAKIVGASRALVLEAPGAVFKAKRPSVSLVNTRLPQLPEWREALRKHLSEK